MMSMAGNYRLQNVGGLFRTKNAHVGRKVLTDGLWAFIGQLATAIGGLAGVRILTEYIEPGVFGEVSLFMGVVLLGSNLTCTPLFQAVLRLYPEMALEGKAHLLRLAVTRMAFNIMLLAAVVLVTAGALHSLWSHHLRWIYFPVLALLLVDCARALETNFLSAARRHRPFALWTAFEAWGRPLGATLCVLVWRSGSDAVLVGYGIAAAVGYIVFRWKGRPEAVMNPLVESSRYPLIENQIWQYAWPLIPMAVVGWISSLSDRYIVGGFLNLEQVGVYAAVYGLVSKPFLILGNVVTLTLRPVYYEAVSRKDSPRSKKLLLSWIGLTAGLAFLGVLIFICGKDKVMSLFLARNYRGAASMVPWIALGHAFYILTSIFEQVICARKQTSYLLKLQVVIAVFSIMITAFSVRKFGLMGAALACPAYYGLQLCLTVACAFWSRIRNRTFGRVEKWAFKAKILVPN